MNRIIEMVNTNKNANYELVCLSHKLMNSTQFHGWQLILFEYMEGGDSYEHKRRFQQYLRKKHFEMQLFFESYKKLKYIEMCISRADSGSNPLSSMIFSFSHKIKQRQCTNTIETRSNHSKFICRLIVPSGYSDGIISIVARR